MKKISLFLILCSIAISSCEQDQNGINTSYYNEADGGLILENPGDQYNEYQENPFVSTAEQPVSTFSIDADGASYANVRRFIMQDNMLPPKAAVRTEELFNYFDMDYDFDNPDHPIALNGELSICPWDESHELIRIGIKGKKMDEQNRPASNYVFLIDVSGSMASEDKLDLLKNGFLYLTDQLNKNDRIAIVTYAGQAGVLLPSTSGADKQKIKTAINKLGAGGSTAGAQGIITAYEIAQQNFIENGNNRIVIGTDGDFNVGPSSQEDLVKLIEEKRELGVFITVLGVGRGNLNDGMLEQIANNGNGTFEYLDTPNQLKKVFIHDFGKFYAVAKDVKVQVNFNPEVVDQYRLIGYENRVLNEEDFEDDTKDAGEIGAGQNITALYEIIPKPNSKKSTTEAFNIDFRYKLPSGITSTPLGLSINGNATSFEQSSGFMKFNVSLAGFGMLLIDSPYKGTTSFSSVKKWAEEAHLADPFGYKQEYLEILKRAETY